MHDINLILTIVGLILTVGAFTPIIYKKRKYPGKLTIIREASVGLLNEIGKEFDEINVHFRDIPLDRNIILLKASIINNGFIDLGLEKINNSTTIKLPIRLKLTGDFFWITSKIMNSIKDMNFKSEVVDDGKTLEITGESLRINEFVRFVGFITTTNNADLSTDVFNSIRTEHRILQTQKLIKTSILSEKEKQKKKRNIKAYLIYLILVISTYVFVIVPFVTYIKSDFGLEFASNNEVYSAKTSDEKHVEVINIITEEESYFSIDEFNTKFDPIIPKPKSFLQNAKKYSYIPITFALIYLPFVFIYYCNLRKHRKISDIIEKRN